MEVPCETASVLDQKIKELIRCNGIHVLAGVAYAVTEDQPVLMKQIHCMKNLVKYTFAAAEIIGLLKSLKADG